MATTPPAKPLAPEQMQAYRLIVKQAMEFLLKEDHAAMIVRQAENGDPKQAVLSAINPLMQQIYQAASQAGARVETPTILAACIEVIGNLSDMLASVGMIEEKDIPAFAGEVSRIGVQQHNARAAQLQQQGAQPADQEASPEPAPSPAGFVVQQGGA